MQASTLKNAGLNPLAQTVRKHVAYLISQLEIADAGGTPDPQFAAFLKDAATKTPGYVGLLATEVVVANGGAVTITDSNLAPAVAGTATVAAGALTNVKITAATTAIVNTADVIPVQNSAFTAVPGSHPVTIAAGAVTAVRLAATVGVVVNAVKQSGWTVTGTGTFFTPTVSGGVCTGGVLSAS